jgi:II/X family phage/plasmid replication protein
MIDWITARVPVRAASQLKTGEITSCDPDGVLDWAIPKRINTRGSHDTTVSVRRIGDSVLEFAGSPAKYLQGHNAFGSDDLIGLGTAMITRACRRLGIELVESEIDDIRAGRYNLLRVDVNYSFATRSRANALAWIEQAAMVGSVKRRGRARIQGSSSAMWGEKSRHWKLKAYSKGAEITAPKHKLPTSLPQRDQLSAWCEDKLRIEVELKARYLRKLGLHQASSWSSGTALGLFQEHLSRLQLGGNLVLNPAEVESLPYRLRPTHSLWSQGANLRQLMSDATYYRHRTELMKRGINIGVPPRQEAATTIPLSQYIVSPCIEVPAWAVGAGLYFDPGKDGEELDEGWSSLSVRRRYGVTSTRPMPEPATPQAPADRTGEDIGHAQAQCGHHKPITSNGSHLPRGVGLERLQSC